jgi:hypothetical protein
MKFYDNPSCWITRLNADCQFLELLCASTYQDIPKSLHNNKKYISPHLIPSSYPFH